jgi:hypothetical protein
MDRGERSLRRGVLVRSSGTIGPTRRGEPARTKSRRWGTKARHTTNSAFTIACNGSTADTVTREPFGGVRIPKRGELAMAKKRISSADLSWLISEELFDSGSRAARTSLAVVDDDKHGWRVIVANRGRRFLTRDDERRLADVQRRLRLVYELQR